MKRLSMATLIVTVCGGMALAQKVVCEYDRVADFSKLKTYKWVDIQGTGPLNPSIAHDIVTLINTELAGKGLALTPGNADLLIGYQTTVNQPRQINWYNRSGPWVVGYGFPQLSIQTVDVGALVLDMYDSAQEQLVWRGSATKALNLSSNANQNHENLRKAIEKLIAKFPPDTRKAMAN